MNNYTPSHQAKGPKRLLDSEELSAFLGLSRRSIERLRGEGLPFFRVGHHSPRYDVDEVLIWIRQRSDVPMKGVIRKGSKAKAA